MCNEGGMQAVDSGCYKLVSALLETSLPVGQANRGGGDWGRRLLTVKRWHLPGKPAGGQSTPPHAGLSDMSDSFQVRKQTTQPDSPRRLDRQEAKFQTLPFRLDEPTGEAVTGKDVC
jgi:hypothetical protein